MQNTRGFVCIKYSGVFLTSVTDAGKRTGQRNFQRSVLFCHMRTSFFIDNKSMRSCVTLQGHICPDVLDASSYKTTLLAVLTRADRNSPKGGNLEWHTCPLPDFDHLDISCSCVTFKNDAYPTPPLYFLFDPLPCGQEWQALPC